MTNEDETKKETSMEIEPLIEKWMFNQIKRLPSPLDDLVPGRHLLEHRVRGGDKHDLVMAIIGEAYTGTVFLGAYILYTIAQKSIF